MKKIGKPIFWILLTALVLRIAYFIAICIFEGYAGFTAPDTNSYMKLARLFLGTGNEVELSISRTPGYPLYISFMMIVFRDGYWIGAVLGQIIANIVAIYFVYLMVKAIFDSDKAACIAALFMAINPLDIRYCNVILTDCLSQATLIFAVYFAVKYVKSIKDSPRKRDYIYTCLFMMLALIIRPSVMYLPFCIAIGVIFLTAIFKKGFKRCIFVLTATVLICATPIVGWSFRNAQISGHFRYTSISTVNLYAYNSTYVYAANNNMSYDDAHDLMLDEMTEDDWLQEDYYDRYSQKAKDIIASDIPKYLEGCAKGVACLAVYPGANDFFAPFGLADNLIGEIKSVMKSDEPIGDSILEFIMNGSNLLVLGAIVIDVLALVLQLVLGIYGAIHYMRHNTKQWYIWALLLGILAYMVVVQMQPVGLGAYPRFRLGYEYIVFAFAAIGLKALYVKRKQKQTEKAK